MEALVKWDRLALNLRKKMPLEKMADLAGMDAGTLRRLARGETLEPKFTQGLILLDLHLEYCPELHHQIKNF